MALAFGKARGKAAKSSVDQYEYKNGDNKVRMVGGLLARYVYWIKGTNDKNIPFECLSFDREAEAFINKEKDWVKDFYPDLKCGWAYAILCVDPGDGKVKVLNLKKKLMEQIMTAAADLGDPTDPTEGWDICFKREKTGPQVYNVEYQLQVLKCQGAKRALSEEETLAFTEATPIDEQLVRPTPDSQEKLLKEIQNKASEGADGINDDVKGEFDVT
jgi:hypothetical protein